MALKDDVPYTLQANRGVTARLKVYAQFFEGEFIYCTDKPGRLWLGDSAYIARPMQTLDMALTFEGNVIVFNSDIVYKDV